MKGTHIYPSDLEPIIKAIPRDNGSKPYIVKLPVIGSNNIPRGKSSLLGDTALDSQLTHFFLVLTSKNHGIFRKRKEGKQVYLIMSKDGQQVYNALFSVPMGLYTSTSDNIGSWIADVYDPVSGAPLGQATLAILPAGGAGGTPGPGGTTTPPGPTGTPSGVPGVFSGMSTGTLLALAAGAFILLSGKKKLL